jgi:hypothetical protein
MLTAGKMGSTLAVAMGVALLACRPPAPAAPPSPPLPTPLNPTSGDIAQEFRDASIVSDAGRLADVALESSALPSGPF